MIWSLTPFCAELDVLEIRLATLDPVVDVHVLVEATVTQIGEPKPVYRTLPGRFDRWAHKIRLVTVEDMPEGDDGDVDTPIGPAGPSDHWRREHFQRDAAMRVCGDLGPDDRVLLSDVDEIPTLEALEAAVAASNATRIEMDMHLYRLNWRWRERPVRYGTRALVVMGRMLGQETPSQLVEFKHMYPFVKGGWHLAYQGAEDEILAKPGRIADAWCREAGVTVDTVRRCVQTGCDIYGRPERQCEWAPVADLPEHVRRHRLRFAHMLCDEPARAAA